MSEQPSIEEEEVLATFRGFVSPKGSTGQGVIGYLFENELKEEIHVTVEVRGIKSRWVEKIEPHSKLGDLLIAPSAITQVKVIVEPIGPVKKRKRCWIGWHDTDWERDKGKAITRGYDGICRACGKRFGEYH